MKSTQETLIIRTQDLIKTSPLPYSIITTYSQRIKTKPLVRKVFFTSSWVLILSLMKRYCQWKNLIISESYCINQWWLQLIIITEPSNLQGYISSLFCMCKEYQPAIWHISSQNWDAIYPTTPWNSLDSKHRSSEYFSSSI